MIGMMADLADDCMRVTRKLDSQRLDPVQFWKVLMEFRARLKSEYVEGRMWLRSDTYTDRIVGFLRDCRVVQFGQEYRVLRKPSEEACRMCQTHLAVVARGILMYFKAEFPECSMQAQFVCFELQKPQKDHLRELLKMMGWDAARSARCLAQYKSLFPHAQRFHRRDDSILECWWQAIHDPQRSDPVEELQDIVGFLTSFLISETECERTFAHERRQFDNRPRLSPEMRFAGLKVMVDGMPLSELQRDGEPVGTFWQCVQERYAQRFGSKPLRTMARRSDTGVRRDPAEVRPGTDGKITMTALQRQRGKAVKHHISFTSAQTDVFGYAPVVVSTLETLREQERTKVFQKVLKKSQAKYEDKQRLYRRVRKDRKKPICFVDSKERKRVIKK